jgi:hypothetical protein
MNAIQLRKAAPMVYGIVAVILWIFVKGTVALVFSIVGALLLGLMYVLSSSRRPRSRPRRR